VGRQWIGGVPYTVAMGLHRSLEGCGLQRPPRATYHYGRWA
jgi:hypothetical protein